MNIIEVLDLLSKTSPTSFTMKDLLSISFRIINETKEIEGPSPLITPYTQLDVRGNYSSDIIQETINSALKSCKDCKRCESKTNVTIPDGYYDAELFIVCDYPTSIDDKTGIPLSGPFELKSSNCAMCSNIEQCIASDFTCENPTQGEVNITFKNGLVNTPGKVLSDALTLKGNEPNKFTSTRRSWSIFIERVCKDQETLNRWNVLPKIYVTNLIKCMGNSEENECKKWLFLERKLSRAPRTLMLGEYVYDSLKDTVDNALSYEEALVTDQSTEIWGKLSVYKHPVEILKYKDNAREFFNLLGKLESKITGIQEEEF